MMGVNKRLFFPYTPFLLTLVFSAHPVRGDELRGRMVLSGAGEASADPEMAQIEVTVTSMCYDSSREAKEANAALAQKIVESMRLFANDERDQIVATGGPNLRQTEVIPDGSHYKTLCERKWRSSNRITLRFGRIDAAADVQDSLISAFEKSSSMSPDKVAQTFAELGEPHFDVYPETATKLKYEAQSKAYDDALGQFAVFKKRCPFTDERLVAISQPQYEVLPRMRTTGVYAASTPTPVIPDEIVYRASWRFEWSYAAPQGCVP
jgi:uncharacterized protein YggE